MRRGATASSFKKFCTAVLSFRQGHQVTEDCRHEDLIKLREGGLLLLDNLKQITSAWDMSGKTRTLAKGKKSYFNKWRNSSWRKLGCKSQPRVGRVRSPLVDVSTWLRQNAIETRARWSEWVNSALEGSARKAHAFSKVLVPLAGCKHVCARCREKETSGVVAFAGVEPCTHNHAPLRDRVYLHLLPPPSVVLHTSSPRTPFH